VAPLTSTSTEDLYEVMSHPRCVMTFSDSGAHVGQIIDSSIHTHLLAYWVRERQAFTLERAVQMITSIPARAAAIPDRGIVAEGAAADLNVFDPDSIAPALPRVAFDVPAGGARLDQRAIGIRATIVAGEVVLTDGEPSGATPGVLLRRRY
jgi:N-acyl-D-aspartate/D-glutamate deacylase